MIIAGMKINMHSVIIQDIWLEVYQSSKSYIVSLMVLLKHGYVRN